MTTQGPPYDADAMMAEPEPYYILGRAFTNSFHMLFPAEVIVSYRQIISSHLCVRLKEFVHSLTEHF